MVAHLVLINGWMDEWHSIATVKLYVDWKYDLVLLSESTPEEHSSLTKETLKESATCSKHN